ncbi:DUF3857 domain-containing protein [uncultured Mediterranea sp.]|uniref:DUF3857 domain-containing protein n=1 Tax=uncultured Mediterranea sp. TaxID=1926662 RepID=UPI0025841D27|nr:DUF3857 domain-containing protein [uncultured Mediterranea sp.]
MKTIHLYIGVLALLLSMALTAQATPEARFGKLSKTYTLHADGSQELRVQKELTLYTHAAMNSLYGETFIVYNPQYQQLEIHDSYTRQKDGTIIRTPDNAFVEVLPSAAANAPAYNGLKEMVVVHTGLELGATICLDYSIKSQAGYLPELDICCPIKELSPIDEFTFRIEVPEGKTLHYELLNASARPAEANKDGMKSITWKLKNVEPRPYSYPSLRSSLGLVQQAASGMMPVLVASTWTSHADALKSLARQFVAGDRTVIDAKLAELKQEAQKDSTDLQSAIATYMDRLYRSGQCKVSLSEAGYRLRPASEVIRSAYGTQAELINLDATLQQAAGLKAEVAVCALRPSEADNCGLGTIVSVVAISDVTPKGVTLQDKEEARLQGYMTVTDLQAQPLELPLGNTQDIQKDRLEVNTDNSQTLPDGWKVVSLKPVSTALPLYAYAANTGIRENILLPQTLEVTCETLVKLPEGTAWCPKADKVLTNQCGKVSFTYRPSADGVTVTRSLSITQQRLTPQTYGDFYTLMAEWRDTNNHTLLLKPAR